MDVIPRFSIGETIRQPDRKGPPERVPTGEQWQSAISHRRCRVSILPYQTICMAISMWREVARSSDV
jgi:hypothetical protein